MVASLSETLESIGLVQYVGKDLRVIHSQLEAKWETNTLDDQGYQQYFTIGCILEYPHEYGYVHPQPQLEICEISGVAEGSETRAAKSGDEPIEKLEFNPVQEQVEAVKTYYGKRPPRDSWEFRTRIPNSDYRRSNARAYRQSEGNIHRNQNIWNSRLNKSEPMQYDPTPSLGSLDKTSNSLTSVKATPVQDKGTLLFCNDYKTAYAEITEWERTMDIAIGMHFNQWDSAQKLAYMEKTLAGNAKTFWDAYSRTDDYRDFAEFFRTGGSKGSLIGAILKSHFTGVTDDGVVREANKRLARTMLTNIRICDLSKFDVYSYSYMRLFFKYGDVSNKELLRMYFEKFPKTTQMEVYLYTSDTNSERRPTRSGSIA